MAPPTSSKTLTPYAVEERIKLDDNCKQDNCQQAMSYMETGLLDEARELLDTQLQKYLEAEKARKKDRGKDKKVAAVYYNLGLVAEMRGDMEAALEAYTEAIKFRVKDPAKKQTRARQRVEDHVRAWQDYAARGQGQ